MATRAMGNYSHQERITSFFHSISSRYTKRYLIKRLSNTVIIFFVVLVINFIIPHLMPGNFAITYALQIVREHPGASFGVVYHRILNLFGLNHPIYIQFLDYMRAVISIHPNFGPSFQFYPTNAWVVVEMAAKWTLLLLGTSQIIAWGVGILVGIYMAQRKDKFFDKVFQPVFYALNTIPTFWLGLIFILIFAITLKVLPPAGAYGLTPTIPSIIEHMILPLSVLIILSLPSHALIIRGAALEVLSSDFITAATAEGLKQGTLYKIIFKNSLLPSLTQLFLSIGYLIGGVMTLEYTFSYPGMGTVIASAVLSEDYPVLQAALYIAALVVLLSNLSADLLYPLIDPRVSYE